MFALSCILFVLICILAVACFLLACDLAAERKGRRDANARAEAAAAQARNGAMFINVPRPGPTMGNADARYQRAKIGGVMYCFTLEATKEARERDVRLFRS